MVQRIRISRWWSSATRTQLGLFFVVFLGLHRFIESCCCCWLWDGFSQWKKARMCMCNISFCFSFLLMFVSYEAGLYSLRISRRQPKIHFDLIWFKFYELLNWFCFVLVSFFLCFFFVFFFFFSFLLIVV